MKPFFSEFSGDLNEMNLVKLLNSKSIIVQLLKTGILNNENLNINSRIFAKQTNSLRDLVNIVLNIKISDGLVDINETNFSLEDYADFKISDSLLYTIDNNLILDAKSKDLTLITTEKDYVKIKDKKNEINVLSIESKLEKTDEKKFKMFLEEKLNG